MSTSTISRAKTERLEARISSQQKRLFEKAARIQGRTLTEFVLHSAQVIASNVLQEQSLMKLSAKETEKFVDSLLNTPAPGVRLAEAAERYKEKGR